MTASLYYSPRARSRKRKRKASPKRRTSPAKRRRKTSPAKRRRKTKGRRRSRSKVRVVAKRKGSLSRLGYSMSASATTRHAALDKAVRKYGYTKTIRKIIALITWNKNRPKLRKIARADANYLRKTHG